jgi:hypothetical protein
MSRLPMDRSRVREIVLVRQDRRCPACRAKMHVAARHQDLDEMRQAYHAKGKVVLTIDGLQPEKGHETL